MVGRSFISCSHVAKLPSCCCFVSVAIKMMNSSSFSPCSPALLAPRRSESGTTAVQTSLKNSPVALALSFNSNTPLSARLAVKTINSRDHALVTVDAARSS